MARPPSLCALLLLGCGCRSEAPAPTAAPPSPSASAAQVDAAIAKWRQAPALAGRYRAVYDMAALVGAADRSPAGGSMVQIHEGTFAKQGLDKFRASGGQRFERSDPATAAPLPAAEVDLLFSARTLTAVNKSGGRVPPIAQVMRLGPALFEEGQPFKLKTVVGGSAFGQGDAATTVEAIASIASFDRTENETVEGATVTAHVGRILPDRAIDQMIAQRQVSLGLLVQLLGQATPEQTMIGFQLRTLAQALCALSHLRVLVDGDGMIRGWDVGPAAGTWAISMRLTNLESRVGPDAFVLGRELESLVVDQTPALLAQTESLRQSFDDRKAVARARDLLRAEVAQCRNSADR